MVLKKELPTKKIPMKKIRMKKTKCINLFLEKTNELISTHPEMTEVCGKHFF